MTSNKMSPEVLAYLAGLDMFTAKASQLETMGFAKCVDYPQLPNHCYLEGYFHSDPNGGDKPVRSMNPRNGMLFDKPAAPRQLRAFVEGLRRSVQSQFVGALKQVLREGTDDSGLVQEVLDMVENGELFADLAVQVHWGTRVDGNAIGWHKDGPNSLLHAALSISGSRSLHSRRYADEEGRKEYEAVDEMAAGDVYVTSPATFRHGVEYPQCKWAKRVIAVQARFLLDDGNVYYRTTGADPEAGLRRLMDALWGGDLLSRPLEVPSLETVKAIEAELEQNEMGAPSSVRPPTTEV